MSEYCLQFTTCTDWGFGFVTIISVIIIFDMQTLLYKSPPSTPETGMLERDCKGPPLTSPEPPLKRSKALGGSSVPLKSESYYQESVFMPDQMRRNSLPMTSIPFSTYRKRSAIQGEGTGRLRRLQSQSPQAQG